MIDGDAGMIAGRVTELLPDHSDRPPASLRDANVDPCEASRLDMMALLLLILLTATCLGGALAAVVGAAACALVPVVAAAAGLWLFLRARWERGWAQDFHRALRSGLPIEQVVERVVVATAGQRRGLLAGLAAFVQRESDRALRAGEVLRAMPTPPPVEPATVAFEPVDLHEQTDVTRRYLGAGGLYLVVAFAAAIKLYELGTGQADELDVVTLLALGAWIGVLGWRWLFGATWYAIPAGLVERRRRLFGEQVHIYPARTSRMIAVWQAKPARQESHFGFVVYGPDGRTARFRTDRARGDVLLAAWLSPLRLPAEIREWAS